MIKNISIPLMLLATPALCDAPKVVTDTPVVDSLVRQVMNGVGEPTLLLDQGSDPHRFQLRPSQARDLANSDLVFWIGAEMTPWLERALEATPPKSEAISLLWAPGTVRIEYEEEDHHDSHDGHDDHEKHEEHGHDDHEKHEEHGHDDHGDHDDHHEEHAEHHDGHDDHDGHEKHEEHGHDDHDHHDHSGVDPHAWLEPQNALAWIAVIEAELIEADPGNAAAYAENAKLARENIEALQSEIRTQLAPMHDTNLFVFHDAYGYFAKAFDLTIAETLAAGDAASPGAAQLAEMREMLTTSEPTCIFAEAGHDPAYITTVSEGTGLSIGTLDPAGIALTPGADLYGTLLRNLANEISGCADK